MSSRAASSTSLALPKWASSCPTTRAKTRRSGSDNLPKVRGWTKRVSAGHPLAGLRSSLATNRPPCGINSARKSRDAPGRAAGQAPEPAETVAIDGDVGGPRHAGHACGSAIHAPYWACVMSSRRGSDPASSAGGSWRCWNWPAAFRGRGTPGLMEPRVKLHASTPTPWQGHGLSGHVFVVAGRWTPVGSTVRTVARQGTPRRGNSQRSAP